MNSQVSQTGKVGEYSPEEQKEASPVRPVSGESPLAGSNQEGETL